MRILIVEDEAISREKLLAIFGNYGYCYGASSGSEAIERYIEASREKKPFDIITLDISLGDMSGMDILIDIRHKEEQMKLPEAKQVRIIMVSSHQDQNHINTCFTAGCNSYLVKPVSRDSVAKCLREVYTEYIQKAIF